MLKLKEQLTEGEIMRSVFKVQFKSNNMARSANWALRRVPRVRLGCAVLVFLPKAYYHNYLMNQVINWSGYCVSRCMISHFDIQALMHEVMQAHHH